MPRHEPAGSQGPPAPYRDTHVAFDPCEAVYSLQAPFAAALPSLVKEDEWAKLLVSYDAACSCIRSLGLKLARSEVPAASNMGSYEKDSLNGIRSSQTILQSIRVFDKDPLMNAFVMNSSKVMFHSMTARYCRDDGHSRFV